MMPLTYCTVSQTPSSPSPPIGPVPTSAQPQEEGASSTGKEPPSVCWMALVLCVCVCGMKVIRHAGVDSRMIILDDQARQQMTRHF